MKLLVTERASYIGGHMLIQLLAADNGICAFNNFLNSSPVARVRRLTNRDALTEALVNFAPETVVHFAGLKETSEMNAMQHRYYSADVAGSLNLLTEMDAAW